MKLGKGGVHNKKTIPITRIQMRTKMHIRIFLHTRHGSAHGVVLQVPLLERRADGVVSGHIDFLESKAGEGIVVAVISAGVFPVPGCIY